MLSNDKVYWFTRLLTPMPADRFDYNDPKGISAYPGVPNYYTYAKVEKEPTKAPAEKK